MATLYVENVPDDVYAALRNRARQNRKSIAAEVLALLQQNIVTPAELKARKKLLRIAGQLRAKGGRSRSYSSAEEMQREDRTR